MITSFLSLIPSGGQRGAQTQVDFLTTQEAYHSYVNATTVPELNIYSQEFIAQGNIIADYISKSQEPVAQSSAASLESSTATQLLDMLYSLALLQNFVGSWSAGAYTVGQYVLHNDQLWFAKIGTSGEPGVSSDWNAWLSAPGFVGPQGSKGPQGAPSTETITTIVDGVATKTGDVYSPDGVVINWDLTMDGSPVTIQIGEIGV